MKQIDRIKSLLSNLNSKDKILAKQFLEQMKIEELKELVDSALVIYLKKKEVDKYKLGDLERLKYEVDLYLSQIILDYEDVFSKIYKRVDSIAKVISICENKSYEEFIKLFK